ncbi:MAG: hypothetical protein DCC75_07550, partial [Proteobacteria bacterium]
MRSEVDLRPLAEQLGIRPQFLAQLPESELAPFLASVGRALQFVQHTDRGGDAARFKEVQALLEDLSCRDASADQIFYRIGQATPIQRQMELVNEERLSRIGSLNYRSGCWMNWIRGLIPDPHSACVQDLRGLSISLLTDISIPAQLALQLRTDPELKTLLEAGMSKSETRTPSGELMDITIKIERKIDVDGIGTIHLTQIGETFELSNTAILGV